MQKWTRTVRLTHWAVATGVIVNMLNESGLAHRLIGYGCMLLVLLRLIDGAWLSNAVASKLRLPSIKEVKLHIQSVFAHQQRHYLHYPGHNPLGQYAVYVMWGLILLLGLTGWISRTDQFWGEDWPVELHEVLSKALQCMVVLHLMAVLLLSKKSGENLIRAMVRGK
ncbi:MAG: cytochrome b/b6 domain-containing protein [Methylotenera sp.]|nr:cytochrome b/b6 domain-containing protein [Methylotenera sp.]